MTDQILGRLRLWPLWLMLFVTSVSGEDEQLADLHHDLFDTDIHYSGRFEMKVLIEKCNKLNNITSQDENLFESKYDSLKNLCTQLQYIMSKNCDPEATNKLYDKRNDFKRYPKLDFTIKEMIALNSAFCFKKYGLFLNEALDEDGYILGDRLSKLIMAINEFKDDLKLPLYLYGQNQINDIVISGTISFLKDVGGIDNLYGRMLSEYLPVFNNIFADFAIDVCQPVYTLTTETMKHLIEMVTEYEHRLNIPLVAFRRENEKEAWLEGAFICDQIMNRHTEQVFYNHFLKTSFDGSNIKNTLEAREGKPIEPSQVYVYADILLTLQSVFGEPKSMISAKKLKDLNDTNLDRCQKKGISSFLGFIDAYMPFVALRDYLRSCADAQLKICVRKFEDKLFDIVENIKTGSSLRLGPSPLSELNYEAVRIVKSKQHEKPSYENITPADMNKALASMLVSEGAKRSDNETRLVKRLEKLIGKPCHELVERFLPRELSYEFELLRLLDLSGDDRGISSEIKSWMSKYKICVMYTGTQFDIGEIKVIVQKILNES